MLWILMGFLIGLLLGAVVGYYKGKRDALDKYADVIMGDIKRIDRIGDHQKMAKYKHYLRNN